ncbi:uncharacterized protein MICPUCDRAFT_60783 [Micromonas pusilla CCMP1545]|jgi:glutathione S-transferase|uniref:Predicted protein n=1 Tax=Micromonas pusilla (strain CCMP1545) TaxID=564608 RepID=C1MZM4_MICPC|nr:uncharacterized protein MICPUCDRAFT_60783 [Micromonas pusilla CCMP1545]EEH54628.1 predicted protein [Micromonas pusilla CCMP1545]|eukprot:XP_003060978.1 predicted protein [Micromonas pusilla CCMP1545]
MTWCARLEVFGTTTRTMHATTAASRLRASPARLLLLGGSRAARRASSRRAATSTPVRAAAPSVPSVYGSPGSRTQIVEWLALELDVPIKSVTLNRAVMASPEYRAVHPFGKIPGCKAEDGTGIFESGAIMLYVADLAGSLPTPEARGAAAAWVIWANATMWPALETSRGKCDMQGLFGPVEDILGRSDWLLGDELSVADVAVGAYVKYGQLFFRMDISKFPNLSKYMAAIESRDAFKKTVGGG